MLTARVEDTDKITKPFNTDKSRSRETGGAGLGLEIAKAIVEEHRSQVEAKSAGKGQGCEFLVRLPSGAAHQV
jgi:signal transduction histidine kinase